MNAHALADRRRVSLRDLSDRELFLGLGHFQPRHFGDGRVEHFTGIRISDDFRISDDEVLTDSHTFASAAVDVDLAVRDLHDRARPGYLRKLVGEELDRFTTCGLHRLADVVVLETGDIAAEAGAAVADAERLPAGNTDDALRREHLTGRRVDDVDRGVHFACAAATTDANAMEADAATTARGVVLHVRDLSFDQQLSRSHLT